MVAELQEENERQAQHEDGGNCETPCARTVRGMDG